MNRKSKWWVNLVWPVKKLKNYSTILRNDQNEYVIRIRYRSTRSKSWKISFHWFNSSLSGRLTEEIQRSQWRRDATAIEKSKKHSDGLESFGINRIEGSVAKILEASISVRGRTAEAEFTPFLQSDIMYNRLDRWIKVKI